MLVLGKIGYNSPRGGASPKRACPFFQYSGVTSTAKTTRTINILIAVLLSRRPPTALLYPKLMLMLQIVAKKSNRYGIHPNYNIMLSTSSLRWHGV